MQRANFDRIFFDISAALGKAENKHPDFCKNLEMPSKLNLENWQDCEQNLKAQNDKAEKEKEQIGVFLLLEEVAELCSALNEMDLKNAYVEASHVAVVSMRIMEKILKSGQV